MRRRLYQTAIKRVSLVHVYVFIHRVHTRIDVICNSNALYTRSSSFFLCTRKVYCSGRHRYIRFARASRGQITILSA